MMSHQLAWALTFVFDPYFERLVGKNVIAEGFLRNTTQPLLEWDIRERPQGCMYVAPSERSTVL
jgi:hypothetical protein